MHEGGREHDDDDDDNPPAPLYLATTQAAAPSRMAAHLRRWQLAGGFLGHKGLQAGRTLDTGPGPRQIRRRLLHPHVEEATLGPLAAWEACTG
jgi:hypothetical protein